MEDQPAAGQLASNNSFVSSPTKHTNPIGTQSNWSFGWQNNSKNESNHPTTGGTPSYIQALFPTIIKAASFSETLKQTLKNRKLSPPKIRREMILWQKGQCGIITLKTQAKRQWCWVTKNLTTVKRMSFISKELPLPLPDHAANDQ